MNGIDGEREMAAGGPQLRGTRAPRWMRVLLILSLAGNLAVLGVVAGAAIRHGGLAERPPAVSELGFGPYTEALDDKDRRALRQAFRDEAPDFRALRKAAKADFDSLIAILRAEPYDGDAAARIVAGQEARLRTGVQIGQRLLLARLAEMTPEERAAFADRLQLALEHPSKRGHDDERRGEDGERRGEDGRRGEARPGDTPEGARSIAGVDD